MQRRRQLRVGQVPCGKCPVADSQMSKWKLDSGASPEGSPLSRNDTAQVERRKT
jgi:hypothetical protein